MTNVCQDLRQRYADAETDEERATVLHQMELAHCDTADLPTSGGHGDPPPPPGGNV